MQESLEAVARMAGTALMSYFRRDFKVSVKKDQSLVTEADLASERIICAELLHRFPESVVYSEENAKGDLRGAYAPGQRVWVVDPLDGTSNFAHGLPYFCVSIGGGIVKQSGDIEIDVGAIFAPYTQDMYFAQSRKGCYKNGQIMQLQAHVSTFSKSFADSFLVTGFYYTKGEALKSDMARFERIAQGCATVRRMGAAALDLALSAEGVFDGFWERGLQPWDVAAGSLIVAEAGGKMVNFNGQTFSIFDSGVVAGRSEIVDSIVKLL